ncbi:MAG TPA: hypothetical protein VN694_10900, partial [Caulobacteraceae bacterium]|nr:hypothetical protein [Caulobacteraceae bacterium]
MWKSRQNPKLHPMHGLADWDGGLTHVNDAPVQGTRPNVRSERPVILRLDDAVDHPGKEQQAIVGDA